MVRNLLVVLIVAVSFSVVVTAQEKPPLKLAGTIALQDLKDGDFDHFAVDLEGNRLFLTAEKNDKLEVLDAKRNLRIRSVENLEAPHSAVFRADLKRLFVVEGDAPAARVYDTDTFTLLGEIKLKADADSMAYDPATHYMYVVNGGRETKTPYSLIGVIDTGACNKLRDIQIPSNHVEAIALERSGTRLFINITSQNSVGVMDRNNSGLDATWPLPPGDKLNVAMALDERNHRLFIAARDPG
jgi:DNA-binding beta-propeller fold protein YncE